MDVSPVLELLRKKIGLNPESIGLETVEKAVREHIKTSGAASVEDYIKKLNGSAEALKELAESVVVKETSFFRNKTPFVTLQDYLRRFVLNKGQGRPLRILCLPCATGEEAYSIAMVLFDIGLSADQFYIHAGDISEQSLQVAKAGRYNAYSFRGEDLTYRKKYFSRQRDSTYVLKKEVRDVVHFEQVNILSENFLPGQQPYDIIFCRNLLIYFDDDAKEKAIKALSGRLSKEGVLFVGHAEGAKITRYGYTSLDYPMSFAFAKKEYAEVINSALNINDPAKKSFSPPAQAQQPVAKAKPVNNAVKITPIAIEPDNNAEKERAAEKSLRDGDIATAKKLADEGSFSDAAAICERLLSEGVESAGVYYLLGQVADSTGDNLLAEEYLKKAIYLDADFYDALIYLSLLLERMGNPEKAASFRRRAQRVKLRNPGNAET